MQTRQTTLAPTVCARLPPLTRGEETIEDLRLNEEVIADPSESFKRWRLLGLLRAMRVSRSLVYPRAEVDAFPQRLIERGARD